MKPFPLTAAGVRARLAQIERERSALLALQDVYSDHGDPSSADGHVPRSENVGGLTLFPQRGEPAGASRVLNGTTEMIFTIVDEQPGIIKSRLIDEVMARVKTTAKKPRRSISNIVSQQVGKTRLVVKQGGYYRR